MNERIFEAIERTLLQARSEYDQAAAKFEDLTNMEFTEANSDAALEVIDAWTRRLYDTIAKLDAAGVLLGQSD
jgi:hypothetical protein